MAGGYSIATTIVLKESPDPVFYIQCSILFFPLIVFTTFLLSMVTCVRRLSALGQIKIFFFLHKFNFSLFDGDVPCPT